MCVLSPLRVAAHGDTMDQMDEAESPSETREARCQRVQPLHSLCTATPHWLSHTI